MLLLSSLVMLGLNPSADQALPQPAAQPTGEAVEDAQPEAPRASVEADFVPRVSIDAAADSKVNVGRTHLGTILLPHTTNGVSAGYWLLDTGSKGMVVDIRAAADIGFRRVDDTLVMDASGIEVTTPVYDTVTVEIGPATIVQDRVVGASIDHLSRSFGQAVLGIIGTDVLSQMIFTLDFDAPIGHIYDPASFAYTGEWTDVALVNGSPVIEASVEKAGGTYVLDTGSALGVTLFTETAEGLNFEDGREVRDWNGVSVIGMRPVQLTIVNDVELLGQRYSQMPAMIDDAFVRPEGFGEHLGTLGNLALRDMVTTFDLGNSRIGFEPQERAAPADDLYLADVVGTYSAGAGRGRAIIDWDGERVTLILGAGQPELELNILSNGRFTVSAGWFSGRFTRSRSGEIRGFNLKLPDGQSVTARKIVE